VEFLFIDRRGNFGGSHCIQIAARSQNSYCDARSLSSSRKDQIMGVEVDYFYSDEVMQANEIQGWVLPILEPADGRYWSLSVVPETDNVAVCQLIDNWWATDNSGNLTAFFDVKMDAQLFNIGGNPPALSPAGTSPGGTFGVKIIRAPAV
jgi:hypothetical protein